MSIEQWGHGYYSGYEKGYSDAKNGIIRDDLSEEKENIKEFFVKEIVFSHSEEDTDAAISIIARLRKKYRSSKKAFKCICRCRDASITKEGWEIWKNGTDYKLINQNDSYRYVVIEMEACPICTGELWTKDHWKIETETNGYEEI